MKHLITPLVKKATTLLDSTRSPIMPFTEKPSQARVNNSNSLSGSEINATELFSMFTADIIKQKVIFTR